MGRCSTPPSSIEEAKLRTSCLRAIALVLRTAPAAGGSDTMMSMHEQLEEYLSALDRDACFRVDEVLKASPHETTERVFFVGANGAEQGPYIRKRLDADCGLGSAYRRLWEAQRAGRRFLHVPRVIECYSAGDSFVVVMEHVTGETLADAVWRTDPSVELAARVFGPVCEAVMELHERFDPPMIHRDLKPSNIMLSSANGTSSTGPVEAIVIDFGIAREYDRDALTDTRSFGTRSYAPPEQFGYGQTDVRSDVYALGLILYYCLTEKTPDAATVRSSFTDAGVPEPLRAVLVRATAFDPAARFASVRELHNAFADALSNLPTIGSAPCAENMPAHGSPLSNNLENHMMQANGQSEGSPKNAAADLQGALPTAEPANAVVGAPISAPLNPNRQSRLRVPVWLGITWNVLLGIVWALFVIVVTGMILEPAPSLAAYAPWGRWVMGYGVFGIGFGIAAFALADKRRLVARFPALTRQHPLLRFVLLVVASFVVILLAGLIAQFSL